MLIVIAGSGPHASPSTVTSATPVGVASSIVVSMPTTCAPATASSLDTAGTGLGNVPWAVSTVPWPTAIGE